MRLYKGVTSTLASLVAAAGLGFLTQADVLEAPQGRLTIQSGTPVMSTVGVTGAVNVYYTPYLGNRVPINVGGTFISLPFAETSQSLTDTTKSPAAAVAGGVYDIFGWLDTSVSPAVVRFTRGPAWSSSTVRANPSGLLSRGSTGLLVNSAAITNGPAAGYGTFLGTVAVDASGVTMSHSFGGSAVGGAACRVSVWNMYNRVRWGANITDTTTSWTYALTTWRNSDASATMSITMIRGLDEDAQQLAFSQMCTNVSGGAGHINIGQGGPYPIAHGGEGYSGASSAATLTSQWFGLPGAGLQTFTAIERIAGSGTVTFYGNNGSTANAALYGNAFMGTGMY